jgi:hypothetical protein
MNYYTCEIARATDFGHAKLRKPKGPVDLEFKVNAIRCIRSIVRDAINRRRARDYQGFNGAVLQAFRVALWFDLFGKDWGK